MGLPRKIIQKLLVQNAATTLLTFMFQQLHWLPTVFVPEHNPKCCFLSLMAFTLCISNRPPVKVRILNDIRVEVV